MQKGLNLSLICTLTVLSASAFKLFLVAVQLGQTQNLLYLNILNDNYKLIL